MDGGEDGREKDKVDSCVDGAEMALCWRAGGGWGVEGEIMGFGVLEVCVVVVVVGGWIGVWCATLQSSGCGRQRKSVGWR